MKSRLAPVCALALATSVLGFAPTAGATTYLMYATLFDADATGSNISPPYGDQITHGAWTTILGQENVPGNRGAQLFLSASSDPAVSGFLSPTSSLSVALKPGANTFYFWANSDDPAGGSATFGLNLFFGSPSSPSISAYAPVLGDFYADSSSCTASATFACVTGSGALSAGSGVTLSSFDVVGRGGGTGGTDLVSNFMAGPDGINDTFGSFTLTTAVPEPSTWAMLLMGFAGLAFASSRRATQKRSVGAPTA